VREAGAIRGVGESRGAPEQGGGLVEPVCPCPMHCTMSSAVPAILRTQHARGRERGIGPVTRMMPGLRNHPTYHNSGRCSGPLILALVFYLGHPYRISVLALGRSSLQWFLLWAIHPYIGFCFGAGASRMRARSSSSSHSGCHVEHCPAILHQCSAGTRHMGSTRGTPEREHINLATHQSFALPSFAVRV